MKSLLTSIVVAGALAVSLPVQAGEYQGKHFDQRIAKHQREYRNDRHWHNHWQKDRLHDVRRDRVRLDIPVRFRGDGKLHLKRMARQHYGIDLDYYRLVRVVFDHRGGRRTAAARLFVGQHGSDVVYLQRGRNVVYAPRARANARWQLALDNARVDSMRLVLEPRARFAKHNNRYQRDDRRYRKGRYNDDWWAYRPFKGEFTWRF